MDKKIILNMFQLEFSQQVRVYSNDINNDELPKDRWRSRTLSFSLEANGKQIGSIGQNIEYQKTCGRELLRQIFAVADPKSDIVEINSIHYFRTASVKAYEYNEKANFTIRIIFTPIKLKPAPLTPG